MTFTFKSVVWSFVNGASISGIVILGLALKYDFIVSPVKSGTEQVSYSCQEPPMIVNVRDKGRSLGLSDSDVETVAQAKQVMSRMPLATNLELNEKRIRDGLADKSRPETMEDLIAAIQ